MDFTPLASKILRLKSLRTDRWPDTGEDLQTAQLRSLLSRAADTEIGRRHGYGELKKLKDPRRKFAARVPMVSYEEIRADVMRMVAGERDVLWRGVCRSFAQSSGTSGGRSKYIPITDENLRRCHYYGASYSVSHYLRQNPESRLFSGKSMILGGSFDNEVRPADPRVRIGDLSATLIDRINPVVNLFRIPDKKTALMADWEQKLPALVEASAFADITSISGVPSWFLTVIRRVMDRRDADRISDVWPNLEVFFHGGISFDPYHDIYARITDPEKMHFMESYNASEGFFAAQDRIGVPGMMLILDNDVYYEFIDLSDPLSEPVDISELEAGHNYEMIVTSSNGLWRYRIGDTVRVVTVNPVRIMVSGRTKSFINAFGEELMEENAEHALAETCARHNAAIANYTAAPVYASDHKRGRHQWIVEWSKTPSDMGTFAADLDHTLRRLNSDYDAKRNNTIFLDPLEITNVPAGTFDKWLRTMGSGKLGGQRKIPRLCNDRHIADGVLASAGLRGAAVS